MPVIGILALQGDFAEHQRMVELCGGAGVLIKHASDLGDIDALIIPGGESTTIAKLTANSLPGDCIFAAIVRRIQDGMPVYGTCMGSIFLAKEIEGSKQGRLAMMDITVKRNAFGPQICSREQQLNIDALGDPPFNAVFIRGPIITKCGGNVSVLATVDEGIVMARQDNMLVTAFHPELTADLRVHQYFMDMIAESRTGQSGVLSVSICDPAWQATIS